MPNSVIRLLPCKTGGGCTKRHLTVSSLAKDATSDILVVWVTLCAGRFNTISPPVFQGGSILTYNMQSWWWTYINFREEIGLPLWLLMKYIACFQWPNLKLHFLSRYKNWEWLKWLSHNKAHPCSVSQFHISDILLRFDITMNKSWPFSKIEAKFCTFCPSWNIWGRGVKMSESVLGVQLRTKPMIYFSLSALWENRVCVSSKNEAQRQNRKALVILQHFHSVRC